MKTTYYHVDELESLGLKFVDKSALISRFAHIYTPETISIGANSRIDDFTIISGKVTIGNHVHIAPYCALFGAGGITLEDYSGLSSRVTIYSESDDYTGRAMTNPTVPNKYRKITTSEIILEKHAIVGTGSTLLPGSLMGEGSALGAMSLGTKPMNPWTIYFGVPAKIISVRKRNALMLEEQFMQEFHNEI